MNFKVNGEVHLRWVEELREEKNRNRHIYGVIYYALARRRSAGISDATN